ncbi:MAG: ScpA family protein [Candidatus Pacebacteria bacterium]|nr:ScpA family protein [Candidatus Paceibacterota bacterium]
MADITNMPAERERGTLLLKLDSYEGPLELLLELARGQKLDLLQISILALVDQYIAFVKAESQRPNSRLELSADYLVMAAWLAYLKSRLLLPKPPVDDEPTGEEMAENLAFQLSRLAAMQKAGVELLALPRLGVDVFARGEDPDNRMEQIALAAPVAWQASLHDLLVAYGSFHRKTTPDRLRIAATSLYSVEQALVRLTAMVGRTPEWQYLASFLPPELFTGQSDLVNRSAVAAFFAASLELAKAGKIKLQQTEAFGPILLQMVEPSDKVTDLNEAQ